MQCAQYAGALWAAYLCVTRCHVILWLVYTPPHATSLAPNDQPRISLWWLVGLCLSAPADAGQERTRGGGERRARDAMQRLTTPKDAYPESGACVCVLGGLLGAIRPHCVVRATQELGVTLFSHRSPPRVQHMVQQAERRMDEAIFHAFQSANFDPVFSALELTGNAVANFQRTHADGTTALMAAAFHGNVPVLERLIEAGASATLTDVHGNDAVALASMRGHMQAKELLDQIVAKDYVS